MEENYQIHSRFEPNPRPRSCTWPLNKPEGDEQLNIEATIEETEENLQQQQQIGQQQIGQQPENDGSMEPQMEVQPSGFLSSLNKDSMYPYRSPPSTLTLATVGFTTQHHNNDNTDNNTNNSNLSALPTDFSGIILQPSVTPGNLTQADNYMKNTECTALVPMPSSNLSNFNQQQPVKVDNNLALDAVVTNTNLEQSSTKIEQPPYSMPPVSKPQVTGHVHAKGRGSSSGLGGSVSKPKPSSRKNAWGNMSYADLITQAIESSSEKRLTLAQIYDWMVKNVTYFKDKGDSNSSAGWKVSFQTFVAAK